MIVIGEVPESDMLKMLQEDWGMTKSLAKKFYEYFGGDIYTTKQALESLIKREDKFDYYVVMTVPGLPSLCQEDPEARGQLDRQRREDDRGGERPLVSPKSSPVRSMSGQSYHRPTICA